MRETECEGWQLCDSPLQVTGVTLLPGATARTELVRDSGPVTALCNNRWDEEDNDDDDDRGRRSATTGLSGPSQMDIM